MRLLLSALNHLSPHCLIPMHWWVRAAARLRLNADRQVVCKVGLITTVALMSERLGQASWLVRNQSIQATIVKR